MSENSNSSEGPERIASEQKVSCRDLFVAFFGVGIIGFGGVMPWVRLMLVEQRRWLTNEEFVNVLSICQILPGANVGNMAVNIGQRFGGLRGAIAAVLGLYCAPFFIVIGLAILYSRYVEVPMVENVFRGVSAAASGLVIANGIKIASPVCRNPHAIIIAIVACAGIAALKLPLLWVIFGLTPVSLVWLWLKGRQA